MSVEAIPFTSADESEAESGDETSQGPKNVWHPVWKRFKLFTDCNQKQRARCILTKSSGKPRNQVVFGWLTTNAMKHLKADHKSAFDAMKCERNLITKSKKSKTKPVELEAGQQQLSFSKLATKYLPQHRNQKAVTRKLTTAFVASSIPIQLIESETFQDMLTKLDEKYDPPSSYVLRKEAVLMFGII